jgi:hypothetical protein
MTLKTEFLSGATAPEMFVRLGRENRASRKDVKFMSKILLRGIRKFNAARWAPGLLAAIALLTTLSSVAKAQDQDDPPGRVARLGYMEGSVSFQPAGEDEWVQAVPNRPMTTGDKLWADRDSRAEVQLGASTLDLGPNTGFSFLNLDDRTVQIQLSAGSLNVRVWDLDRDNVFEIDTPNQAFTVEAPGRYRIDASEDGNYTVVTIRDGQGESTGNGQSYTMHAGQRFTLSGTTSLNAEVDQIGPSDDFDNWSDRREARYQNSPSARYCDRRVVGYEDLDDYGDWRSTPDYGYAWFPRVDPGWAPYHEGHWAWIDPWGWTWVDNDPWGYAPFHYGRWAFVTGRWGWIPGPMEVRPVYAPALVAFVGGGVIAGGAVAWFPLGPREVYVPSYPVSEAYVNRVNVTNTTVNTTVVRNVYNTTIVNNNTTINNVTYVNRNVQGAVTAVPQRAFATAQPVAKAAVAVNPQQLRSVPVSARAAVAPAPQAVLGVHANTAGRVAAPPRAVITRPVIAKVAPPPAPPAFAARQQALAQHPGQPLPRQELQKLRPANPPATQVVKVAPPAKPATPTPAANRPTNQPGQPAANARPGASQPAPANRPAANNRPEPPTAAAPPARNDRPPSAQPNRPEANPAMPNARPQPARPDNARPEQPAPPPARNDRPPSAQPNRPEANPAMPNARPQPARPDNARPEQPAPPPARNDRPPSAQPNRPEANPAMPNARPQPARPDNARPEQPAPPPARNDRPEPNRAEPTPRSEPPERTGNPPAPPNNRYSEQPNARPRQPAPNEPARTQVPPPTQRSDRPPTADGGRPAQQDRPQQRPAPDNRKQDQNKNHDQKEPK